MDIQYKIIGGDDTEYGPASLTELKSWISRWPRRRHDESLAQRLSIWSPADRYTELLDDLARLNASVTAAADRDLPPAGFWVRLMAAVIDNILIFLIFFAVWTPIASQQHWQSRSRPRQ